ncbi:MAG: glutathione S-transferase family protein [Pseudomonadota bacterium]
MILVHHLRIGRSIHTVWLLEELGIDYELKIYDRQPTGRAPAELREAHPLGKSPVIVDGDITLSESGAITAYLLEHYDEAGVFQPDHDRQSRAQWNQWLHYSEGSAFAPLLIKLIRSREGAESSLLIDHFAAGEVALHLSYIQDQLGDKPFILGERLMGPDFGIAFILKMAQGLGELEEYSRLTEYLQRMLSRPAFQRAMERTGG